MELAKVTSKGQITIPIEIRKKLGIKVGDKVLFMEEGDKVVMVNATIRALEEAQAGLKGVAEQLGLESEEDVGAFIKAFRAERAEQQS